jgi:hypothetical protein
MAGATAEVIKKKFPELDVQVEPGAALVNMEKIRNDKADLGWSMTNVLSDALTGTGQWSGKKTVEKIWLPLLRANFQGAPNPVPVKAAMLAMGLIEHDGLRLPLLPMAEAPRVRLVALVRELGLVDGGGRQVVRATAAPLERAVA